MKLINGYLVFNGQTDAEDAPVSTALALLTGYRTDIYATMFFNNYLYQRCANAKYTVSRDQSVAIFAIVKHQFQNDLESLVSTKRVNGKDLLFMIGSHIRTCKGLKPNWQDWVFKLSLWYSAKYAPLDELSQIFIMLLSRPDNTLLKWYCNKNPQWREAINIYLKYSYRDETELADHMIKHIEEKINA